MRIESFEVEGFRSLRKTTGKLDRTNVVVGPNGVGKSNLYRAFEIIHLATDRQLARAIAGEGGMHSVRWAGRSLPDTINRIQIRIVWDELEYELVIGEETTIDSPFPKDPFIRTEKIWSRDGGKVELIRRAGPRLTYRNDEGHWTDYPTMLATNESMLCQLREPERFPEIVQLRRTISEWRFYHTFRTDPDSPLRTTQPAFRSQILDADGGNLAAMLMAIQQGHRSDDLRRIVANALHGAAIRITGPASRPLREVGLEFPDMDRVWVGREISDGSLRILALCAALLSDDTPEFLVLNEPETSLHSSVLPALAEAINIAAERSQLLVVTHSMELADAISVLRSTNVRTLRYNPIRGTELDTQVLVE